MEISIDSAISLINTIKNVYITYKNNNDNKKCIKGEEELILDIVIEIRNLQKVFLEKVKKLNIKYKFLKNKDYNNEKHTIDDNIFKFYNIIDLETDNILFLYAKKSYIGNGERIYSIDLNTLYNLLRQSVYFDGKTGHNCFIRFEVHPLSLKDILFDLDLNKECNICFGGILIIIKEQRIKYAVVKNARICSAINVLLK
jgi:hypothetical protein